MRQKSQKNKNFCKADPLEELHRIREKMYEETKHMTAKEHVEYIRKEAAKFKRRMKNKKTA